MIDRELYLPLSWTADRDRCMAAGVSEQVEFATKPEQGMTLLERAHAPGVLRGWVTADEAYGQNRGFRDWSAARGVPFVLATRSDDLLTCPGGRRCEAKVLAALAGPGAWERRSAGPGAHGERLYDRAVLVLDSPGLPDRGATGCWSAARSPHRPATNSSWPSTAAPGQQRPRSRN